MTDTSDTSQGSGCGQVAKDLIAVELEALERSQIVEAPLSAASQLLYNYIKNKI